MRKGAVLSLVAVAMLISASATAVAITYTTSTRAALKPNKASGVATALTRLVSNAAGPALTLETDSDSASATPLRLQAQTGEQAPVQVNSSTKVQNLNADQIDGMDSTEFAPKTAEAWHEVGAPGEPPFDYSPDAPGSGLRANFGAPHNTAGS